MASRSLGVLTIDLIAKTGLFEQGMDKAGRATTKMTRETQRKLEAWRRDIDKTFKAATIAASAVFAGISAAVRQSINDMHDMAVQAQQVAMPVDQFTAYAAAADNAEVKTQDFMTAMRTLLRNLQNAQLGSTRMQTFFRALDIDPSKIKDGDQALKALADSFARYKDDANKAAIATQLMGRSGAAMIPFLDQGSAAIQEQTQHMLDLGVAFGQDGANALAAFDDASDELHNTIKGLTNQLSIALLPSLVSVNETLIKFAQNDKAKDFVVGLADVFKTVARSVIILAGTFETAGSALGAFGAQAATVGKTLFFGTDIRHPIDSIKALAASFKQAGSIGHEYVGDTMKQWKTLAETITTFGDKATKSINNVKGAMGGDQPSIKLPTTGGSTHASTRTRSTTATAPNVPDLGLSDLQKQLAEATSFMSRYGAEIAGVTDQEYAFTQTSTEATKALQDGWIGWAAYQRIIERARDQLNGVSDQLKDTGDQMSEFAKQAAHNMQDAFADFLFDPFDKGLKGMLGDFADTLRKMAAQAIAAKVFDAIGNWGKQNAGAGGFLGAVAGFASSFGGGRALGGPVLAGAMYRVNEQGPEMLSIGRDDYLMMGNRSGHVTPAAQTKSGGSITVNQYIQPTSTKRTADQVATATMRKLRTAQVRNG